MKNGKIGLLMFFALLAGLTVSCVSMQDRTMTAQERAESEVIGSVTTEFTSTHFLHNTSGVKNKAYAELKKVAQQRYSGNIDIKNIVVAGSFSGWNIVWGLLYFTSPILLNVQKITASGDVVLYNTDAGRSRTDQQRMGAALDNATQTLIDSLPRDSTIAVLSISSSSRNDSEYIVDELEYRLVNSGRFAIVDRRRLDQIRSEQNFQMSGDVDDNSAVSIGNMLGASIVITGNISNRETSQYMNIKAIDVKSARIITMAREQY